MDGTRKRVVEPPPKGKRPVPIRGAVYEHRTILEWRCLLFVKFRLDKLQRLLSLKGMSDSKVVRRRGRQSVVSEQKTPNPIHQNLQSLYGSDVNNASSLRCQANGCHSKSSAPCACREVVNIRNDVREVVRGNERM